MTPIWGFILFWGHYLTDGNGLKAFVYLPGGHNTKFLRNHSRWGPLFPWHQWVWGTLSPRTHYDSNDLRFYALLGVIILPLPMVWRGFFLPGGHYTNYLREHSPLGTTIPLAPVILGGPLSLSALYNTNDLRFYAFLGVTMSPIPMVWRTFFLFTRGTLHQIFKGPFSPGYNYSTYTNNLGDHYPLWTTITPIIWEPLSPRTH